MDSEGIKTRIVSAAKKKGITLSRLIVLCNLNEQSFYRYMKGSRDWSVDYLVVIARKLELNLDYLITGAVVEETKLRQRITTLETELKAANSRDHEIKEQLKLLAEKK